MSRQSSTSVSHRNSTANESENSSTNNSDVEDMCFEGIIPIQAGTNKFASQKGMTS